MTHEDRELCDWLAVHVMGYRLMTLDGVTWYESFDDRTGDQSSKPRWNPIEDANDTDRLMSEMRKDGWCFRLFLWPHEVQVNIENSRQFFSSFDKHWKRAVCLATKAAKESE